MQVVPRYLVKNRTTTVLDRAGFSTEYRPVYSRHVNVFRGIDNVLEFRLLNSDQKPVDLTNYTPKFQAYDENNNLIVAHDGVSLQDSTRATQGQFKVTISENDLLNVKEQFVRYNIHLVAADGSKEITYSKSHFENDGVIHIKSDAFPSPSDTYIVSNLAKQNVDEDKWYSEAIDAQPAINGNEALHTIAVYTDSFVGNVTIEGTLDNQIVGSTDWATIDTVAFTGSETQPVPSNFNGVFSYIRLVADADPANKISQILVRN
jgi:hypothetical protein